MIKFSDILEGYGEDDYGFRDSSFDNIKIYFEDLCSVDEYALVKNKNTNELYITYMGEIDSDYEQGWYSYEKDWDEETGWYMTTDFSDDTEITEESISLYTQQLVEKEDFTTNVSEYSQGTSPMSILKITPENRKDVFMEFIDLLKCYFDEPRKK